MSGRRRARISVPDAAADMIRRYGKSAGRRARDREDKAETEETAGYWQRVELEIDRVALHKPPA